MGSLYRNEAGSAVWQLRQFDSMADWEIHQDRIRADNQLSEARKQNLYPHLDEVNTSILRLADISPRCRLNGRVSTMSAGPSAVTSNNALCASGSAQRRIIMRSTEIN